MIMTHSFAELSVHHKVMNMFLRLGQLQLPGYYCYHQGSTASSLHGKTRILGHNTKLGKVLDKLVLPTIIKK